MNTLQSSRIRRWTLEVDAIRRRVTRSMAGSDTRIGTMLANCLSTCENLLQELVRGEDERERLRLQAAAERDNWQRLFDIIPPACLLTDSDGVILGANRAAAITALIKRVAAGRTVLMVEHNMNVVATIADRITVLARGSVLAEGDYATVSGNAAVREAYMGTTEGELAGIGH